jgi:GT2 family glycosyltransferase
MQDLNDHFSYNVIPTMYYTNTGLKNMRQLSCNEMPEFEKNGKDLCIAILNYNRVELSIKLLCSMEVHLKNFEGEILIIDNNSDPVQFKNLENFISTSSLNIKLKRLDKNYGVGGARNIAAQQSEKTWIMFLDSDMYFISNPLLAIKNTIELLGVNFLNLPIIDYDRESVFALGGALFISNSEEGLVAGGGSVFDLGKKVFYTEIDLAYPFISDFLFGGCSVLNRELFLKLGGFDKDMFIGFEDTDFSLRLYQNSIKIGNIPQFCLIHDHKPSKNNEDIKAEKERYSSSIIEKSGIAFYKKHGIKIFDQNTKDWLNLKQEELVKQHRPDESQLAQNDTPRVILVIDKRNWAFHNIAKNIEANLKHKFNIEFMFSEDFQDENWIALYHELYKKKPEIIYFFWRPTLFLFNSSDVANGLHYKYNIERLELQNFFNKTILLTSVYDHLFLTEEHIDKFQVEYSFFADKYTVSSEILNQIYSEKFQKKPFMVIQDGVDLDKFKRQENKKAIDKNALIVGWVGNSQWGMVEDGKDHKGFISIIKPAVEQLQKEGLPIVLKYCDSNEPQTLLSHDKMTEFYNSLDIYLCLSDIEGTPNTVLEAMACGIPIISTNVGIVNEVFGKEQKKLILKERNIEELKCNIKALYANPSQIEILGNENLTRIQNWTWKNKTELFDLFFSSSLKAGPKVKNTIFSISEEQFSSIKTQNNSITNNFQNHFVSKVSKENEELNRKVLEIQNWYKYEYEVLPLWYKRIGHVIKLVTGKKSLKSLFNK